jgi:hypothetical protein
MICFAAFGYAQVRGGLAINRGPFYSVKLTATPTPAYQSNSVALATTVYSKDPNSMAAAPADVVTDSRVRYAYASQRTWPCVGNSTTSSSGATNTSGILAPGNYKVTVHVTTVDPQPRPPGYVPLPAFLGEASATFTLRAPASSDRIEFSADPPYESHAPATLHLTSTIVPAASGMRYIFTVHTFNGPLLGTQDSAQSSYTFVRTIPGPGATFYSYSVDEIRQSDCAWLRTAENNYKYELAP